MSRHLGRAREAVEDAFRRAEGVWSDEVRHRFAARRLSPALRTIQEFERAVAVLEQAIEDAEHAVRES